MTTFYDEIVAGIVTLLKYCMHSDIYEKQTNFQYIYDFSKCCQGNSFHKIYLIQKIYSSEQLEASSQAEKNLTTTYTFLYENAEGYSGFLGLIDIFRLVNTKNGALNLYLMDVYRRCNKENPQFWLESV